MCYSYEFKRKCVEMYHRGEYPETQNGISEKDFWAKMYISLKETAETSYWIELLLKTGYITKEEYCTINNKCQELNRLFNSMAQKHSKTKN